MKAETIKAIFTNVLFVIGVILVIIGFIQGTLTVVRSMTFAEYPLDSYEETRCDLEFSSLRSVPSEEKTMTEEELAQQKATCKEGLEHRRKVKQTEDIASSVTTLVSGAVLVYVFRRFIFR